MKQILINMIVGIICIFLGALIAIKTKFAKDESHAVKTIINLFLILVISISYMFIFYKSIVIIFSDEPITIKSALVLLSNIVIIFGIIIYAILEYLSRAFKEIGVLNSIFSANFKIIEEIAGLIRLQSEMIKRIITDKD